MDLIKKIKILRETAVVLNKEADKLERINEKTPDFIFAPHF